MGRVSGGPVKALSGITLALVATSGLAAQQGHEGHDEHLGRVRFPVSCNAEAHLRFERGVALLHSFWYEKAEDALKAAVAADSTCAMGYWGQAMAILHPLWTAAAPAELGAGLAVADRGLALAKTPHERDYLQAIRSYYAEYATLDAKARLVAYSQAMDGVQRRNPRDREARIFYALSLIAIGQANATDTTFAFQKRADSILEPLFKAEPEHPGLAHHLIHTNDVPELAHLGLYAARRYAQIAPAVPHAQHMPSHIFTRLGLWDEDIVSNLRSVELARQFEEERHLNALWDQRGHAWDYLVYAYLQTGRDGDAKRVVTRVDWVTAEYPVGSLTNAYALAAIPARYALERGRGGHRGRHAEAPGDPGRRASCARAARRPAARAQPASRCGAGLRGVAAPGAGPGAQPLRPRAGGGAGGRQCDGAGEVSGVPDADARRGRRSTGDSGCEKRSGEQVAGPPKGGG